MNKKLENLIKQLSENEQKTLAEYIERQYAVEFRGDIMLRDDIFYKITELLHIEVGDVYILESTSLESLELDAVDITSFAETLLKEFKLEEIQFSNIMEWEIVADIVNTVEQQLECATHNTVYMSGFEIEA